MTDRQPRYSRDEFARRGQEIYDRIVRPTLQPGDDGKFIAIDIESSRYAIDSDDYSATQQLLDRDPNAQIWLMRAGETAAYRIG